MEALIGFILTFTVLVVVLDLQCCLVCFITIVLSSVKASVS